MAAYIRTFPFAGKRFASISPRRLLLEHARGLFCSAHVTISAEVWCGDVCLLDLGQLLFWERRDVSVEQAG